jgi:hypothetical protein
VAQEAAGGVRDVILRQSGRAPGDQLGATKAATAPAGQSPTLGVPPGATPSATPGVPASAPARTTPPSS